MSTIKVDSIKSADGNTDLLTLSSGAVSGVIGGRRNLIINGAMQVAQRGTSLSSVDGYSLDRWRVGSYAGSGGVVNVSQGTFTPAQGYPERFKNYLQYTVNTMPSGQEPNLHQRIEDVVTANGEEVTLSFWAKVTSGTASIKTYFSNNRGATCGPTS